ncbi:MULTISPECIES: TetR/AcrR family transcriptional regulator [unclassified Rathayibacter]|uniref:TetR/AcrR family transcriptional regulator n=1 Tax=unclassified Rathayibacter TaxID=2609250 RepID=UPI0006F8C891|nr:MULTISPECIES: TetR/AcrR family transcriptional regulator [unclassified Rathayibacter]KQQ05490.1 hypothetical protein ASF42_02605 [Rathayibacter sp. Leaf294]KQS13353.1 hypothetical protein ASG06_02615 [Rathayibacter sp. Leaf185]
MSRSTSAYHHGNLAPALEAAAFDLLRTQGHATLSLREVARAAGVSHNAPYHHFGDRTALLKRLSEVSMAELLASLTEAQAQAAGRSAQAGAVLIGGAYVGYASRYPERFRIIYDPEVCVPGSPSAAMAPLIDGVEEVLATATASLLPADASPAESAALTTAVWGAVHGLAELVVAGHITEAAVEPALIALLNHR